MSGWTVTMATGPKREVGSDSAMFWSHIMALTTEACYHCLNHTKVGTVEISRTLAYTSCGRGTMYVSWFAPRSLSPSSMRPPLSQSTRCLTPLGLRTSFFKPEAHQAIPTAEIIHDRGAGPWNDLAFWTFVTSVMLQSKMVGSLFIQRLLSSRTLDLRLLKRRHKPSLCIYKLWTIWTFYLYRPHSCFSDCTPIVTLMSHCTMCRGRC